MACACMGSPGMNSTEDACACAEVVFDAVLSECPHPRTSIRHMYNCNNV